MNTTAKYDLGNPPRWLELKTEAQWKQYIQQLLVENDKALVRSVLRIDARQTEQERRDQASMENNNVGWNKWDARGMGSIARRLRNGEYISDAELHYARVRMPKYWRQLMVLGKASQQKWFELLGSSSYQARQYGTEVEQFKKVNQAIVQCSEQGKPCSYGICDECILTQGCQTKLNLNK